MTGDLMWEMDMQQYTDGNFNQDGVQARTADYRERKVGLFGDFLERIGRGKYVEWVRNEEQGREGITSSSGDEGGRACGQAAALGGADM